MNMKSGIAAIVFDRKEGKNFFLLLHRAQDWNGYEFVKETKNLGENQREAVIRVVKDETNLECEIIDKIPDPLGWAKGNTVHQYFVYLVRVDMSNKVEIDEEHDSYEWVEENEVKKFLEHDESLEIFEEGLGMLKEKYKDHNQKGLMQKVHEQRIFPQNT